MAIGFNLGPTFANLQVSPDRNLSRQSAPRVLKAQFGDGYEQRLIDGINSITESYNISFNNRPVSEIDDIMAFFDSKAGVTSFNYTISDTNAGGEKTVKVVADTYNITYVNDITSSCTAVLRRVYEP
jgi:phage-related protein